MNENNNEKKFVTLEMFEEYHKKLMEYIGMHDDLILNGETTCPKCGATITSDKCNKCSNKETAEICPECGGDLVDVVISLSPFVTKKECTNCDWLGECEEYENE